VLASEECGCDERKKRNDWFEEGCQIKVEEINKVWVKILKTEY
jgi:hypothetical protein